jgi:hypothetical protein
MRVCELDCDVDGSVTSFVAIYENATTKEAFSEGL